MAPSDACGAYVGESRLETAAQVTRAFRAAARARRGQHEKPRDVLTRAFATCCPGDGRASVGDFKVVATKLGLEIPTKDIAAVFETSEHVMMLGDGLGKENVRDGGDEDGTDGDEDVLEKTSIGDGEKANDDDEATAKGTTVKTLLLYQPWIDETLGIHVKRDPKSNGHAPVAQSKSAPSERTRVGPLRSHDPSPNPDEIFNYPQCRTPVFPPFGWSEWHQNRSNTGPDKTLELDHVHGCGPGLADRTANVPIFVLPQLVPEKPPKRGKAMDDRAALLEGKTHEEFVFYAAGVGVVQTSRVDEFESTHGLDEDDVSVSKPKITKKPKDEKQSQRHFRGHDDDVRCLSVHALTRVAASGETGLEPKCMVWSIDARSGEPPMAVLKHPRGLRAVIGVAFDARGERIATVCSDDGHTVSLWQWNCGGHSSLDFKSGPRVGRMLWSQRSYQTAPPAVRGVLFSPVLSQPDLLVSYGTTHVRFWKPDADDEFFEPDETQKLVLTPNKKPFGDRKPWKQRAGKNLRVEDVSSGVFLDWVAAVDGSDALLARSEGVHSIPHLSSIPAAEEGLLRGVHFVSGTPNGKLLFWENGDGTVPAVEVCGSRHRGAVRALTLSANRQNAGSPRLLLSGDACGAVMCWAVDPRSGRIAAPLGGVFLVENPPKLIEAPPPTREDSIAPSELWLESDLENEPLDDGDGDPLGLWVESFPDVRGLGWSPSGKYYLVTTANGSVWRVDLEKKPEEDEDDLDTSDVVTETGVDDDDDDEDTDDKRENQPERPNTKVVVRGHDAGVTCVAWSAQSRGARLGIKAVFATGSSNGRGTCWAFPKSQTTVLPKLGTVCPYIAQYTTDFIFTIKVVVWNAKTRESNFAFDAGGPVRSICFSPDGVHLACGVDKGRIHVFNLSEDPTLAPPNNVQPRFHAVVTSDLKTNVTVVSFSPDGNLLAAGDGVGNLELFKTKPGGPKNRTYRKRSKCVGHASGVLHIDWSVCSGIVKSSSTSYEVLCHAAPSGVRLTREPRFSVDARETSLTKGRNERGAWHTWCTPLGFELMGLWRDGMDGTSINGAWRFGDGKHVVSCDDDGTLRVLNFPAATAKAPFLANKAHSKNVAAAVGSWCDQLVVSVGGRDCCVMQWKVVSSKGKQAGSAAKLNGLFELSGMNGKHGGAHELEGFDRSMLERGIVNIKTLDHATADMLRVGKVQVEQSDDDESSSDDGDDGIWNAERTRDVAEVDDVYDDLFNDVTYVVPEQGVNKQVRTAHFALQMQQPGAPKSKLWATREEVAERRAVLEHELRKLGRDRPANAIHETKAGERAEWAPATSVGDAAVPPPPVETKKKPQTASAQTQADEDDDE